MILASNSASRRAMLEAAGLSFASQPADVDERALEAALAGAPAATVALELARAKALAVSATQPGELVLGSDSLVVCDGRRFDKPASRAQAAEHLRAFSGKVMHLHSAAALARDGVVLWSAPDLAALHVIAMSPEFIAAYLDAEWPAVAGCVGVFRIEARGVTLFERIEGDYFTILGMPLMKVLGALRDLGELAR
ncbi:Maf family protein [Novosphingobium colocasiae]|uniref:Nucleoside triphosphate pyrophosphatase n=1 Tax=Novosphingobium colocasiae TaxID=1256513 RepID=A0A918PGS7_9SPHN|nr:nucleoside triphosphate pyrophosphatase [Novosphingobium colocasiae]GGZ05129.1 Maf-like protein [Novosphingobium colocasiae]